MPIFFTAVANSRWVIYRWLESWPMRYLGLISYTFYLVHLRALRLTAYYVGGSQILDALLAFAAAVAFAAAMYYLVERHLAALRRRLHRQGNRLVEQPNAVAPASDP
jgi:peptidoglycan/LPS O-acetylase OafA/YrhL